jgi:glycosyltransferase involved in cell wall biosynthesis
MKNKLKFYQENTILIKRKKKNFIKKNNKLIISLYIVLIIILLFSLIILINKINNSFKKKHANNNNNSSDFAIDKIVNSNVENLLQNYTYNSTIKKELIPYLKYIEYCKNGFIFNKSGHIKYDKPKVSIIISMYNRCQYINSTIRSIQNQILFEIEIIVVDDFSDDNSIYYVKNLQKEDPRIILLQNKENMGTLYSKSIGVLYAKGEYIQSLDSDDMLCNRNYLNVMYNSAIKGNFDFVGSKAIYINELKKTIYFRIPYWVVIWSKFIKKKIYLDSIYKIGIEILKLKVKTLDDDIIALDMFINKTASFEPIIGVVHYIHESSHVYVNSFKNEINCQRFCTDMLTTIKAFYMFKDPIHRDYGKRLFNNMYKRGRCSQFYDLDVKELEKYEIKI